MGPIQPCAICTEECDQADAFHWPCNHAYHGQCVARYYARVPKPPCPLCRRHWTEETEHEVRNVCEPCVPEASSQSDELTTRLPPIAPPNYFAFCSCVQPPVPMIWAPTQIILTMSYRLGDLCGDAQSAARTFLPTQMQ